MVLRFTKFHGTGNDFILIDNREGSIQLSTDQIRYLCDRHLGIGADGLMLMNPSSEIDFSMLYFNADGLEGSMCGNGGRCIAAFAHTLGIEGPFLKFSAFDGIHEAVIHEQKKNTFDVSIGLNDVIGIRNLSDQKFVLNTGSPHYVAFVDDPDVIDIVSEGRKIRWASRFQPEGINVNYVRKKNRSLYVRTYERGVENTTLSCGTGVTASAVAASAGTNNGQAEWDIQTLGGPLHVSFVKENDERFTNVWLRGLAIKVFEGHAEIS
jgi:diaminopimelate epimerase